MSIVAEVMKAAGYFPGAFQQEIAAKAQAVPEHIVEPKASIAGPLLQGPVLQWGNHDRTYKFATNAP